MNRPVLANTWYSSLILVKETVDYKCTDKGERSTKGWKVASKKPTLNRFAYKLGPKGSVEIFMFDTL